jgi:hypothetical protein
MGKRALIWQWFNEIVDSSGKLIEVECKECKKNDKPVKLIFSNMRSHLRIHHVQIFNQFIEPPKPESLESSNIESSQTNKMKRIDNFFAPMSKYNIEHVNFCLISMICLDLQPISIVENEGFLSYSKSLNSNYKVPSRSTVVKLLHSLYETVNDFMMGFLHSASKFALTTDIWKSDSNRAYITLTAHFTINKKLVHCSLDTQPITINEKAETIKVIIEKMLTKWEIEKQQISAIVTDNASNIISACNLLGLNRIPCMGHLNLCVSDLIKNGDFKNIFSKCKTIVTLFRKSGPAKLEFDSIQMELDPSLKSPYALLNYTKTRWNSRLQMISRIINLKLSLERFWEVNPDNIKLSSSEFGILKDFESILSPLAEATCSLSGSKYITISTIIPIINLTIDTVSKVEPTSSSGKIMKAKLLTALNNRFKNDYYENGVSIDIEQNKTIAMSSYIDPRFKRNFFDKKDCATSARAQLISMIDVEISQPKSQQKKSIWSSSKYDSHDECEDIHQLVNKLTSS